jgi:hypothetical protein
MQASAKGLESREKQFLSDWLPIIEMRRPNKGCHIQKLWGLRKSSRYFLGTPSGSGRVENLQKDGSSVLRPVFKLRFVSGNTHLRAEQFPSQPKQSLTRISL